MGKDHLDGRNGCKAPHRKLLIQNPNQGTSTTTARRSPCAESLIGGGFQKGGFGYRGVHTLLLFIEALCGWEWGGGRGERGEEEGGGGQGSL